ncbi:AfsR/SARP family transcriptional regulator [Geomobilimonas luticola]|uniref:DNA-binding protein n=1 Tax=Geomobilimonas luticola TaxID=1114878 RepID=A0ABS5SGF7_9BACT|nr:BTAD domain-containing putative transcriptional regulator [Geomobilimonas luticola]MBT0654450.1 DNA-binding protein [Geomobilimonas luticola]
MARTKSDSKATEPVKLDVRAFGGLSIYYKGAPITILWESQKARLLFCYLLVTYDQWVHRDKLIEVLWPGCDVKAGANNFKTTVSRLRKSFSGPQTINPVITQGEAVRLDVNVISLDASLFRYNATNGIKFQARGDNKAAREFLEAAQDLYTGDFLPEEPFNPFISAARSELHQFYVSVITSLEKVYHQEQNSDAMEALLMLKNSLTLHHV